MTYAPVAEGALDVFMVKSTFPKEELGTKQIPGWVEIEPDHDVSNIGITWVVYEYLITYLTTTHVDKSNTENSS